MPPDWRRGIALAQNGRYLKLDALARLLADCADTPHWIAYRALCAAIPYDHEHELDDPANDLPALERAVEAMGLDVACLLETTTSRH